MRKMLFSLLAAVAPLVAAPQAVVFDWGDVLATPGKHRYKIVEFLCETIHIEKADFERVNEEKRKAVSLGQSETAFWQTLAQEKGIELPHNWAESYKEAFKASVGANDKLYALVGQLKRKGVRVGLLSNIDSRYTPVLRDLGFYEPFDPCLLSCDIGLEKPDPKIYQLLLDTLQMPANKIVFIDDKQENVEAANRLGMDGIVFESAEQVHSALKERGISLDPF
jgi:epoxide hydrolase-like predicted phosphatase